jgi:hypothetical protein
MRGIKMNKTHKYVVKVVSLWVVALLLIVYLSLLVIRLSPPYSMPPGYTLLKNGVGAFAYSDENGTVFQCGKGIIGRHLTRKSAWGFYRRNHPDPKESQWEKVK